MTSEYCAATFSLAFCDFLRVSEFKVTFKEGLQLPDSPKPEQA